MEEEKYYHQTIDSVRLDLYHATREASTLGSSYSLTYLKGNELSLTISDEEFSGKKEIKVSCICCGAPILLEVEYSVMATLPSELLVQFYNDKGGLGYKMINKLIKNNALISCLISLVFSIGCAYPAIFARQEDMLLRIIFGSLSIISLFYGLISSYLVYYKNMQKLGTSPAQIKVKNQEQSKYFKSFQGIKTKTVITKVSIIVNYSTNEQTGIINEKFKDMSHYLTDIKSAAELRESINQAKSFPIYTDLIKYQDRLLTSTTFIV
jgi:hypothetical protein